jgi:DNA-binding IclR family transcriptional regulator
MASKRKGAEVPKRRGDGSTSQLKEDRHFVVALARGLDLLACFRERDRLLGNQELARRCGLAKSTVSRLTYTLMKLGYLTYVGESAKYALGSATLSLGSAMLGQLDIRKLAHPLMQELADFSRCLVSLASRDGLSMIYIDTARGSAPVTLSLDTGSRIDLATTAAGRAYLCAISETARREVMEAVREGVDATRWRDLKRGLAEALLDIRKHGVCCSLEDWHKDVNSIAVPVRPGSGLPPMAISCGGPTYIASHKFLLDEVRPRLIAVAANLEKALGTVSIA